MKQNITIEQLKEIELSPKNFEKLGRLTNIDYASMVKKLMVFDKKDAQDSVGEIMETIVEDFNLGNLLEIIDNNWFIELNSLNMNSDYNFQLKIIERKDENNHTEKETYYGDELIDLLWEAMVDWVIN